MTCLPSSLLVVLLYISGTVSQEYQPGCNYVKDVSSFFKHHRNCNRAILSNADVLPSTPLLNLWKNDFWGTAINSSNSHGSYRPISVITFRLNYWISGFKSRSYHIVNVILHSISTYLVFILAKIILPHPAQITATALFAVHPVHCEAVASVVGRADILANIFFILSFLCYIEHVDLRNRVSRSLASCGESARRKQRFFNRHSSSGKLCKSRFYDDDEDENDNRCDTKTCEANFVLRCLCQLLKINIYLSGLEAIANNFSRFYALGEWLSLFVTLVFATLAMFSKETGLTVLAVCATYDIVRTSNLPRKRSQLCRSLFILALAGSALLVFRIYITGNNNLPTFATSDNPTSKDKSFLTRTLTFLYLPVFNFLLLIYPLRLSFDWSMDAIPRITSVLDPRNVLTFLFYTTAYNFAKTCLCKTVTPHVDNQAYSSEFGLCEDCWIPKLQQCVLSPKNGHYNGLIQHPHQQAQKAANQFRKWRRKKGCECLRSNGNSRQLYEIYLISLSVLVLPFIPATNLFFYVGFVVAERVLYIPSVGYCFFIAVGNDILEKRTNFKYFRFIISALIIIFGAKTVLRNKDWYNEESLYKSGLEINPPKAYANLGSILSSQGRIEEAERALKLALHYRPNMADAHYNLGILQQGKAQYTEAINSYRMAIHYRPSLALAYLNLGQLLMSQGSCEEAEDILRRCSKLDSNGVKDPKSHESTRISALLHLGRLQADRGKYEEAVTIYKEAVASLPEHYQPQVLYNLLGEALAHLGQRDEAEKWHRAAIQAKPNHTPTYLIYGKLLARNKTRIIEAEEEFLKAQTLAPGNPTVHLHFGQFLSQVQRYAEAANQYLEAFKLAPSEYEFAVGAATAFRQAGYHQRAEQLYKEALSLRPMESGAHINLGAMLHLNGKFEDAAKYYQTALKLNPQDQIALLNLNKLKTLAKKSKT